VKIIAKVDDEVVLVQMSRRELARLAGYSYENCLVRENRVTEGYAFRIGAEYKIHETWDRLEAQAAASQKLNGISTTLTALADLVKQTEGALVQAVEIKTEGGAQ
jgi:hypothetical protein